MEPIKLIDGCAMIARVEELNRRNQVDIGYVNIVREAVQMQPEAVVHCADCDLARELTDTTKPYHHREEAPGWSEKETYGFQHTISKALYSLDSALNNLPDRLWVE